MDAPSQYDFDPNNLPEELLEAIGLAIASAAHTEVQVNDAIAALAGLEFDFGGAITTHMNMALKYNVLLSLGELVFNNRDELAEFDNLILKIQTAFEKRNNLAHNQWALDANGTVAGQIFENARNHYTMKLLPLSVHEVKATATEIYEVGMRLFHYLRTRNITAPIPSDIRPRAHEDNAARKAYRRHLFG